MTLSHLSVSDLTNAPNSSGLTETGVAPSSASCNLIFGEISPALISRFSVPMIFADVPRGTPMPYQMIASYPGTVSANGRQVGKNLRSRRRRHAERPQLA